MAFRRVVARVSLPIALVLGIILSISAPAAASGATTEYDRVLNLATSKIGSKYVHYGRGPNTFDCVGFVWYAFKQNELQDRIGGYRGVRAYYNWFKQRGLVGTSNPQVGDLVIWGNFQHIGMYVGEGNAISALVRPYNVRVHPVKGWLNVKFRYYLHTRLER